MRSPRLLLKLVQCMCLAQTYISWYHPYFSLSWGVWGASVVMCTVLFGFVSFFSRGVLPLQTCWSLSRVHGLDLWRWASVRKKNTTITPPRQYSSPVCFHTPCELTVACSHSLTIRIIDTTPPRYHTPSLSYPLAYSTLFFRARLAPSTHLAGLKSLQPSGTLKTVRAQSVWPPVTLGTGSSKMAGTEGTLMVIFTHPPED